MLRSLTIQNFVLMDHLHLAFEPGMIVFTGETGAGKSMLLDAMDLLLGGKGDKSLLRNATKPLILSAVFQPTGEFREFLHEQGIEHDAHEEIILRRVIDPSGKSKAFIHDVPVSLLTLKKVSECAIEIHGQMDRLLKPSEYRNVLDQYAGHNALLASCAQAYHAWKEAVSNRKSHEEQLCQAQENLERLRFEKEELDQISPKKNEETTLEGERADLKNRASFIAHMRHALHTLSQQLQPALFDVQHVLSKISTYEEWSKKCDGIAIELSDLEKELKYNLRDDQNPNRLDDVEERLSLIRHVARKHRCRGDGLDDILMRINGEIESLENAEKTGVDLLQKITETRRVYEECAKMLSLSRQKNALTLASAVQKELPDLKLAHAHFSINVENIKNTVENSETLEKSAHLSPNLSSTHTEKTSGNAHGMDRVDFLFQANPGILPQSLHKVASGGELSRLMLALKVAATQTHGNITEQEGKTIIVFDEIDSGVGGAVAASIGAKLRTLGEKQHIFCITHAPQVASYGHHHYKVLKTTDGTTTSTHVELLNTKEREQEIARMLSGENITKEAIRAAQMLMKAGE